jgi:hypothetical protein
VCSTLKWPSKFFLQGGHGEMKAVVQACHDERLSVSA